MCTLVSDCQYFCKVDEVRDVLKLVVLKQEILIAKKIIGATGTFLAVLRGACGLRG